MTRLWVRTATAFRAKRLPLKAGDFVRAWPSRDTRQNRGVLAVADGAERASATAFAPGAATMLDALDETADQQGVPDVERGVRQGRKRFLERTPAWTGTDAAATMHDGGWPSVSYTVVSWNGDTAQCRWLGTERAELYRAFAQAQANVPHMAQRGHGKESPEAPEEVAEPWPLQAGDTLVLLSHTAKPELTPETIAYLTAAYTSPVQLANALLDRAFHADSYAFVSVARFDAVDFPAALASCIDAYQAPAPHEQVAEYARRFRLLPLIWDSAGFSGLDEHGRIVATTHQAVATEQRPQLWSGPDSARLEHLFRAAEQHPELACLAPRVPEAGMPPAPPPSAAEVAAVQAPAATAPKPRRFWEFWKA